MRRARTKGSLSLGPFLALTLASCGSAAPTAPPPPAPARPRAEAVPVVHPARYLVPDASWVERTADGLDRVVMNGRRMELRGVETAQLAPADPEVSGGAVAPAWAGSGPSRYVFWKGRDLYGAETFTGELHKIASLSGDPERAFDWIDGTGLILPGGAVVVPVSGGKPKRIAVAAVGNALAADARRAVAVSALGHVFLTVDGGKSFRDASADLGPAASLLVRGDDLVVVQSEGRGENRITASGEIGDGPRGIGVRRGRPPDDPTDLWPGGGDSALRDAVRAGLPLPDGGAVIASRGFVGRLDLATLRTTSVASLDGIAPDADCFPFQARDATLLACAGRDRASVVDISGVPRLERSFDLTGAPEGDRFVGSDGEALGYLGRCDGTAPKAEDDDTAGDEGNASRARSAVFCVRVSRDEWVEHRLDPDDQADAVAWIPRQSGGAVALVARAGTLLRDEERVSVRGGLRVVRVARNEPPFAFAQYGYRQSLVLDRGLRVGADDTIEGWLPASSSFRSVSAVTIDASGHARAFATPPRANQLVTAGRWALAQTDDGRLFETVDGGHRWGEVDPPPGAPFAYPSQCSPVGCQIGSFVRIGWSAEPDDRALDPTPSKRRSSRERGGYTPPKAAPSQAALHCGFDGPADGKRVSDAYGFGATAWSQPRGAMPTRLGSLGVAMFPWNGPQVPMSGDVDVAWISPLDLAGRIRRTTISLGHAGVNVGSHRTYEVKLGYIVDASGALDVISTGYRESCLSTLLDVTGVTRSLGGCAEDPSVGVDLGGKVLVLHPGYNFLATLAADAPPRRKIADAEDKAAARAPKVAAAEAKGAAKGKAAAPAGRAAPALPPIPVAIREIKRTQLGIAARGFSYGAGTRDGAPVVVALDRGGGAFLAPIDPERGSVGAEEPIRALTALALGSDAVCAGARPGEARIAIPLDGQVSLDRAMMQGVYGTGQSGVAVIRWSKDRACLDAIEMSVRDERFDTDLSPYEPPGTVRKLVARFAGQGAKGKGSAALLEISNGVELRQPVTCKAISPGDVDGE